jgi:uncharacterized protein with HEPN domain
LRCIARIEEYTAGGRESFFASHLIQDGVLRNLQTLAEVLVHDYLGVDLELVYRAVDQDVPKLKVACEAALPALDHSE